MVSEKVLNSAPENKLILNCWISTKIAKLG